MLKKITAVYFSPTGGTRKAALFLAQGMAEEVCELDLSFPKITEYQFQSGDCVLFAAPVWGGRVPAYEVERIRACCGNGAVAVTAAVYGGRAYEDALLELNDCVAAQGFRVAASAALLAEHSIYHPAAAGRPDEQDRVQLGEFAAAILKKLAEDPDRAAEVPGDRPYRQWSQLPVIPAVLDNCVRCGLCAKKCPTAAIPGEDPATTLTDKCILCMRCVSVCPQKARALPAPIMAAMEQKLSPFKEMRRENELFL